MILGRIVREAAGPDFPTAFAFPRRALFDPIGARTAVLEVDGAGNFTGGTFFHASARDYARLGLLYLNDGVWNGRRILPEGWVAYTVTPTPNTPENVGYGAQFWLNRRPALPGDLYYMSGHQGQSVSIIPSREAVIVRVGLSEFRTWRASDLIEDVLAALPPPASARSR
jgi:CubicO group peptidase (beta-lactamase class C family)